MNYCYIRVSTEEQNIDRQMTAMREFVDNDRQIFIDKQSGENFNRPAYKKLLKKLRAGDVLYIKSIDRLGRNYEEILEQWRVITRVKQADIYVYDFPLLDTRRKDDSGLTGRFVADLVLQILSYVAQTEREFIKQRQREGIFEAKKKGAQFGRPKVALSDEFEKISLLCDSGKLSIEQAADKLGMSKTTFYRYYRNK